VQEGGRKVGQSFSRLHSKKKGEKNLGKGKKGKRGLGLRSSYHHSKFGTSLEKGEKRKERVRERGKGEREAFRAMAIFIPLPISGYPQPIRLLG